MTCTLRGFTTILLITGYCRRNRSSKIFIFMVLESYSLSEVYDSARYRIPSRPFCVAHTERGCFRLPGWEANWREKKKRGSGHAGRTLSFVLSSLSECRVHRGGSKDDSLFRNQLELLTRVRSIFRGRLFLHSTELIGGEIEN